MLRIAQKFKLRPSDKPSFMACLDASSSVKAYVQLGIKTMEISAIPAEVCGCQARTLTASFKKENLADYDLFMKWVKLPARKGTPRFNKANFAKDINGKQMTKILVKSFDDCTLQYVNANVEEGLKILTPYVDEAKLKKEAEAKKKKEAEALKKKEAEAAAKKKSET